MILTMRSREHSRSTGRFDTFDTETFATVADLLAWFRADLEAGELKVESIKLIRPDVCQVRFADPDDCALDYVIDQATEALVIELKRAAGVA